MSRYISVDSVRDDGCGEQECVEVTKAVVINLVMVNAELVAAMEVSGRFMAYIADDSGSDDRCGSDWGEVRLAVYSVDGWITAVEDVFEMSRCAAASIITLFSIVNVEWIVFRLTVVCKGRSSFRATEGVSWF